MRIDEKQKSTKVFESRERYKYMLMNRALNDDRIDEQVLASAERSR